MNTKSTSNTFQRIAGKGLFPPNLAFTLLIPFRNVFLSPRKLIQRLELEPDAVILEVGPGPGYFSIKIAQHIPKGKLVLADIQQEMLDFARKRIGKKRLTNVEYHLCNGNAFPFPDKQFDTVFMVTVIGEVEHQKEYIAEFYRIMKPGGILSFSEQAGDPDKLSINEIKALVEGSGFEFYKLYGSERNFTINFKKAGSDKTRPLFS